MASSSVYSSLANSSYSYFRILAEASATESGTSVANNTSTVSYTVKVTFKPTNGHSFVGTSRPNAGYVDILVGGNVVKTITVPLNNGVSDGTVIASASGSTTVAHNADGTGSTTLQVRVRSGSDQNNYNFVWSNATGSASTLSLSTIPRASSISSVTSSVVVNGSNAVIVNISRKSSSFTHTVTVYATVSSSETVRLQQTGVGTSVSFTLPIDWIRAIGSNASATAHVMIRTYSGSTQIGDVATATFTITKPSASDFSGVGTIECNGSNLFNITIYPVNSAFTHNTYITFGGYSDGYTNVPTSHTFKPYMEWLKAIPNDLSGVGSYSVDTYYGNVYIGRVTHQFTLTVPTSVVPTISSCNHEIVNPSSISSWGIFIQNISTSKITVNASGTYGSTITGYSLFGTWQTSNIFNTGTSNYTGDQEYIIQVKDSRGRVSEIAHVPVTIVPYSPPTLSCNMINRCLSNGTVDDEGTYIVGNYSFSCASCGGKNSISARIYTREVTADDYTDKGTIQSGTSKIISSYEISKAYTVKVVATDAVGNSSIHVSVIETSKAIIDILKGGGGMAIGMMASKQDTLQIGYGHTEIDNGLLDINYTDPNSGKTVKNTIGSQNGSYMHYMTNADQGHYFGQDVVSAGDIYGQNTKKVLYEDDNTWVNIGAVNTFGGERTLNANVNNYNDVLALFAFKYGEYILSCPILLPLRYNTPSNKEYFYGCIRESSTIYAYFNFAFMSDNQVYLNLKENSGLTFAACNFYAR